jgi:hypothetical protein
MSGYARGALGSSARSDADTFGCNRDEPSLRLHIAGTFGVARRTNNMLPRLPHRSPLGRLLKNAWISGTRGKSPDFTVALVTVFMTEEGQASRL